MEREKMIIDFYEDGRIPKKVKIKIWIKMIKEGIKNELRHFRKMDTTRHNKISNDSNNNIRTN